MDRSRAAVPSPRFACPRGHLHYERSAFCTVCGAGPVLEDRTAATLGYPVQLSKLEARLLLGMLTNPAYRNLKDYDETVKPLIVKLEAVL